MITGRRVAIGILLIGVATHGFSPTSNKGIFSPLKCDSFGSGVDGRRCNSQVMASSDDNSDFSILRHASNVVSIASITAALLFSPLNLNAHAEDELALKYAGKGFDSSLVDQSCFVDKCSLQAKACLADDPDCRKGMACVAKCVGDNNCITGCFARYGDDKLDNFLKCTIEDNECIKVAILDGGMDKYGEEPKSIAPTVVNFNPKSLEGAWYKVVGFNPNYDCYACQKNTFSSVHYDSLHSNKEDLSKMQVDVEFKMPRMLPDGSPPILKNEKESIVKGDTGLMYGSKSVGFNEYATHEVMVFDEYESSKNAAPLQLGKGRNKVSYARTAHSEGEMFGLKFWENWYVIGENDPNQPEFKFIYYNGKTRQNTYEGGFVYSRTKELGPEAMKKIYKIASDAGMNPDNFCKIRNECFRDENLSPNANGQKDLFRSIIASTKISELLGVEPVAAESIILRRDEMWANSAFGATNRNENKDINKSTKPERPIWFEIADYLENPHRHYKAIDSLRLTMEWPDYVKAN